MGAEHSQKLDCFAEDTLHLPAKQWEGCDSSVEVIALLYCYCIIARHCAPPYP